LSSSSLSSFATQRCVVEEKKREIPKEEFLYVQKKTPTSNAALERKTSIDIGY